jgi:hypothetical protein
VKFFLVVRLLGGYRSTSGSRGIISTLFENDLIDFDLLLVPHFSGRKLGLVSFTVTQKVLLLRPDAPLHTFQSLMQQILGHCVLTLGTDTKVDTDLIFESWGRRLLKEHNYAVVGMLSTRKPCRCADNRVTLDIKEVDGVRLLTVLDSRIERGLLEVGNSHLESARPGPSSSKSLRTNVYPIIYEVPFSTRIFLGWDMQFVRGNIRQLGSRPFPASFRISRVLL